MHWTKKLIYQGNQTKAKVSQIPHLHKFAQICSGAKIDIALDLPPVAMTVNVTFAQDLRLCAKVMCSSKFGGHLHMAQM